MVTKLFNLIIFDFYEVGSSGGFRVFGKQLYVIYYVSAEFKFFDLQFWWTAIHTQTNIIRL